MPFGNAVRLLTFSFLLFQDSQKLRFGLPVAFAGMCDASAAIFDGDRVLVLNDEDQAVTSLRYFDPLRGGGPVRTATLPVAGLDISMDHPEIDIEAATLVGSRLFILGSHSRGKNAQLRTSRQRLFAVEWPVRGEVAKLDGRPYTSFLSDAQRVLTGAGKGKTILDRNIPPHDGGVNLEGMAEAPDGGLFLCFRSPLIDGKALLLDLRNPLETLHGAAAKLGPPLLLNLDGQGFRDMVWDKGRRTFWILSGPVEAAGRFRLWQWSGSPSDAPVLKADHKPAKIGILGRGFPEALALDRGNRLWMFVDEGSREVNGTPCKIAGQQGFHGMQVDIP